LNWTEVTTLQSVIDHGDGTETVTISDLDLVIDRDRKFIRIRVTQLF